MSRKDYLVYFRLNMQEKYTTHVHMITVVYFNTFPGVLLRSIKMVCMLQEKTGMGSGMLGYVKIKKHVLCHRNVSPFYKNNYSLLGHIIAGYQCPRFNLIFKIKTVFFRRSNWNQVPYIQRTSKWVKKHNKKISKGYKVVQVIRRKYTRKKFVGSPNFLWGKQTTIWIETHDEIRW